MDEIVEGYRRYVAFGELIHLNDLTDDTTSLLSTNQGFWFCLDLPIGLPPGWSEIAEYGGRSHDLKKYSY